ncbi:MAG: GNAT family N-acetyltransferase [Clostridia bacterium]|nr:GNAT family N-acetyltransferase [Clostridia bacterium]
MEIIKASEGLLPEILRIYEDARRYMREHGNAEQWAGGYPQESILRTDIAAGNLYVCAEDSEICGVFCYFEGEDPTYRVIEQGQWLNERPYGVIHRVAVARHRRGVASFCFAWCYARCENLKIDTHRDNLPMQRSLEKNGFVRCGIIHLENGDERIAYQKSAGCKGD